MQGAHGTEDRSVFNIHEDLSTGATTQFAAEVEFPKRSNVSFAGPYVLILFSKQEDIMTTFVGTQTNFIDAVKDLIELDYDAVEAYEAPINRLDSDEYKAKLKEFMHDHKRHIEELGDLVEKHGETPPAGPSMGKQWITKGKVVLANLIGDDMIIKAMLDNEKDTNTAYEKMHGRDDRWDDAKDIIKRGLEDEKRHKAWMESVI